jgi:hypothetical protein
MPDRQAAVGQGLALPGRPACAREPGSCRRSTARSGEHPRPPADALRAGRAAGRAQAVQLNLARADHGTVQVRPAAVDRVADTGEVHVEHLPAAGAHEMMMLLRVRVVLYGAAGAFQHGDDPRLDERLDVAVDRGMGDRREDASDVPDELVGRGMVAHPAKDLQQDLPLRGHSQTEVRGSRPQPCDAIQLVGPCPRRNPCSRAHECQSSIRSRTPGSRLNCKGFLLDNHSRSR